MRAFLGSRVGSYRDLEVVLIPMDALEEMSPMGPIVSVRG